MDQDDDNIIELAKRRTREIRKVGRPKKGVGNEPPKNKRYTKCRGQPLTNKQEAYSQHIAAGVHFIEAFKKTYDCSNMAPDTIAKFASRMKNHPKVKDRTLELKRQIRRALDAHCMGLPATTAHMPEPMANAVKNELNVMTDVIITRQWVIKEQIKNIQLARETAQVSAAVAATNSIAKIEGFDQDSREKQVTGELERMSQAELKSYIREELSKTGGVADTELGQLVEMRVKE